MNYLKTLGILSISFGLLQANEAQLKQQKMVPTADAATHNMHFIPPLEDWKGFQISLTDQPLDLAHSGLLFGFPLIGNYNPGGYNFRKRLALIQAHPSSLKHVIPKAVQKAIEEKIKLEDIKDVRFSFMALGTVLDAAQDSPDNTYNLVYHPWAGIKHRDGFTMNFFDDLIPMGLFEPDGIAAVGNPEANDAGGPIALQRLFPRSVNWHAPEHLSPNNARFAVARNRSFSSFWAVAITPDKTALSITYFLLANNHEAEHFLAKHLNEATSILALDNSLMGALMEAPFSEADKITVNNWMSSLYSSVAY